jgi:quinol-cytochrome oxidoreductase complex cytochrome b subunit
MNGASFIFGLMYLHIGRALFVKSYLDFRPAVWYTGIIIFVLMMATAFLGYVLPWGQMSFWAATVITNIFTALPNNVGEVVVKWLWGDFGIGGPTLFRFFSLHVFLPAVAITGILLLHINFLHDAGSSNSISSADNHDMIPFYPYFYVKDLFLFSFIFWIFMLVVLGFPNAFTHAANFIEANSMVTPKHIVPEWYFLPFYAMLRAIPSKGYGIICLVLSIFVLFLFPKLDKSQRLSPIFLIAFQVIFWLWVAVFCLLGYCGAKHAVEPYIWLSRVLTAQYFGLIAFILVLSRFEKYFTTRVPRFEKQIKKNR